jgi:hypothetical protein
VACRICLALGIDDPWQWLHEAEPEKVALWEAFYKVEPFGSEWEQSAMVAQSLTHVISATAGVRSKSKLGDFMPDAWDGNKKRVATRDETVKNFKDYAKRFKR